MRIEISHVIVEDHVDRLRDTAQAPWRPLAGRVWAIVRRRREPLPTAWIERTSGARESDRLAA